MPRHSRKGNIHKVREFDIFTDVLEVNSLTAKMLYKYVEILNSQAKLRMLPSIQLKVIDEEIKPNKLYDGSIYRKDYTISILSPEVNIGTYRPLKLVKVIKEFQRYNNFNFFEATQPLDNYGNVIKEFLPYFQTNSAKNKKSVDLLQLLKVSKIIIDTYGYCRSSDNTIEGFNWLRTTGQRAFDILTTEPNNEFKELCINNIDKYDKEINSMLVWSKICMLSEFKYKSILNKTKCEFNDVNKVAALIPIYRNLKLNEKVSYFVHE